MEGEVRIYTEKKRIYKEYTQKNIHRVYTEKRRVHTERRIYREYTQRRREEIPNWIRAVRLDLYKYN